MYNNCFGKLRSSSVACAAFWGVIMLFLAQVAGRSLFAQEPTELEFRGGFGVIPVTGVNAAGAANLNVVRGVIPAGPWRIADLNAFVSSDGHISVRGRGLLLANGNGIGTNAGASVFATLFCGPADGATAHSSNRVPLSVDGDFKIEDVLTSAPVGACETPVLLIRNGAGSGVWFAAAIPYTH